jgi:hypothetical protein
VQSVDVVKNQERTPKCFLERFYDTPNRLLLQRNIWLRYPETEASREDPTEAQSNIKVGTEPLSVPEFQRFREITAPTLTEIFAAFPDELFDVKISAVKQAPLLVLKLFSMTLNLENAGSVGVPQYQGSITR